MQIKTRKVCGKYMDVQIESENTVIDLGFHDKEQAKELLEKFKRACEDLENYLEKS